MAERQPLHSTSDQTSTEETTIENGNHQLGMQAPTWQVEELPVALNPSIVPRPPPPPPPTEPLHCPRCDSTNTKFCYYNNYSLLQPRHYCKTCKRHWTNGGVIRNVPMGGGSRKAKRPRNDSSSVSFSNVVGMTNPTISPPPPISFSLAQPNQQFQLHQQYYLNNANAGRILGGNDGSGYRRGLQLPPIPNGIPMIQLHGNHGNLHRQMSSMGPNHEHLINYQATTGVEEASFPGQAPFMMPAGGMPAGGNGSGFLAPSMKVGGFGSSSTINSDTIPYNWPPRIANVNHISSSAMTSPTFSAATAAATSVGESQEDNEFMRWQKEEYNQKNLN